MKHLVTFALCFCSTLGLLRAGEPEVIATQQVQLAAVPTDFFNLQSSYVFGSDVMRGGVNFGSQDAFHNSFEYGHRFLISGNFYFHVGVAYERFDFGKTDAPLPVHLQSGAAVIGIDYMHGEDVGAFLEFRPGIYTENKIGINSFDCPITLARFWTLSPDKFYFLTGVNVSFLRASYPVLPVVGFVWNVSPQWQVFAIPPAPKVIYKPSKTFGIWAGGELIGGSFRTDPQASLANSRLNGASVDYIEYRAGAGVSITPTAHCSVDLSAGYAIQREFDFDRADHIYRTDPAPYAELAFRTRF